MLSKIVLSVVLIIGTWLINYAVDAKTDPTLNQTGVRADHGNCLLSIQKIKIWKIVGKGKSQQKPVVVDVYGHSLVFDSNATDPQCGNVNGTGNGSLILEYTNIQGPDDNNNIDNFTLIWEFEYKKRFRWWDVTSLIMTMKGAFTGGDEIRATFSNALMKSMAIGAPDNFGYACSRPSKLFYSTNRDDPNVPTYGLEFRNIHIQPFLSKKHKIRPTSNFTENVDDCVEFFSAQVWMFLWTLFIFASVIIFGVIMLSNMATVNRFDDPKTKPMVIIERN